MLSSPAPDHDGTDPDRPAPGQIPGATAAERALGRVEPDAFSPAARVELEARIEDYVSDLVRESVRVASRHEADVVSPAYVKQASGYLVARTRDRKLVALGSLGAVLCGAALPTLLEVPWASHFSSSRVLFTSIMGMAGSALFALRFVKE